MKEGRFRSYLEIATNISVLIVAVALLITLVSVRLTRSPGVSGFDSGFRKGEILPSLPSIDYGGTPQTMLIAMSTRCSYCKESLPFYKQLVEEQSKRSDATRVVAIFPNNETDVQQYKQQNQLNIDSFAGVNLSALKIAATPTIILADSSGKVRDFWIGKLSKEDENQVLKAMGH